MMATIEHHAPVKPRVKRCVLLEPLRTLQHADALKEFGECVYLFNTNEWRPSVFDGERFCDTLMDKLKGIGFDAKYDYVVMSGSVNALIQLAAVVAAETDFIALIYCSGTAKYVQITL
jgi:hypothetical protein